MTIGLVYVLTGIVSHGNALAGSALLEETPSDCPARKQLRVRLLFFSFGFSSRFSSSVVGSA
jgi:hypothetical protein